MDPTRADALLGALLFAGGMVELALSDDTQTAAVVIPATAIATVLLAYRRRAPVPVVLAITVVAAVGEPLGGYLDNTVGGLGPYLLAVFTAGAAVTDLRRLLLLGVGISLILMTTVFTEPSSIAPGNLVFIPLIAVAAPLFAGRLIGGQVRLSYELHEKNRALELEREERTRAAVADERARVARELHDVVAHSVSVMVVQAGAAEQQLPAGSPAREQLGAVRRTGKETLVELRRQLGVLREAGSWTET
jgi:signal transduction histidine kinase